MKKYCLAVLLLIVIVAFSGCGELAEDRAIETSDMNAAVTEEYLKIPETEVSFMADYNAFALQLLTDNKNSNTMVSPLSVLVAMSMVENGASGETLSQMEKVFGMTRKEMNDFLAHVLKSASKNKNVFHSAQSVWMNSDMSGGIKKDYLALMAQLYQPQVESLQFDEKALLKINGWVDTNTEGMIPSVLDHLEPSAAMCLINAIAFNGKWKETYEESMVREKTFTNSDGTTSNVDMMFSTEKEYLESAKGHGFVKYYDDNQFAFVCMVPKEAVTLDEMVKEMTGQDLEDYLSSSNFEYEIHACVPKFKSETSLELADWFENIGMKNAFSDELADFSEMYERYNGNLVLDRIVHKTFVEVNEEGTRAAAVTAVTVKYMALAPDEKKTVEVYLDKPFLYMIVDTETKLPIFIGTVDNL